MLRDIFKSLSQQEIVAAIQRNDDLVLRRLYQDGFPKVMKFVWENQGSEEEAKDVFQESFLAMWQNVKKGAFVPANETAVQGYLFQIAKNKWLDILRSQRRKLMVVVDEIPEQMEQDHTDSEQYFTQLEKAFSRLGDTCRQLLTKFYFQKESMASLAAHFGWNEATAKNNKYRCMERLRSSLASKKE